MATRCRPSTAARSRAPGDRAGDERARRPPSRSGGASGRAGRAPRVGARRDRRRPLGRARRVWVGDLARAISCSRRRWRARRCSAAPATRTWRTRPRSSRSPGTSAATASGRGTALAARGDRTAPSDGERFWMISHAELLLADGERPRSPRSPTRWRDASAGDLIRCGPRGAACLRGPRRRRAIWRLRRASRAKSWRSLAAAPHRGSWGEPAAYGELTGDGHALREAVALLDATSARLERAKAHAALGEPATRARAGAACGADGLAARLSGDGHAAHPSRAPLPKRCRLRGRR